MALLLKANVRFGSNVFAMCIAAQVVESIYREIQKDCVITSANDSTHGVNSLHSHDGALDFRSHMLSDSQKDYVLSEMKRRLNEGYDILLEGRGTANEHYHIETDP